MRRLVIAVDPASSRRNDFVNRFRTAIENTGATVVPFTWKWASLLSCDLILVHWPRSFFDASVPKRRAIKALAKLLIFRWLLRGRLVWVVHNLDHHESGGSAMARHFIRRVDGFLFLSQASVGLFDQIYRASSSSVRVVSVHGRYPGTSEPHAWTPPDAQRLRLLHFGLIRSYKNIEELVAALLSWSPADLRLTIAGARVDRELADRIEHVGQERPDLLSLDMRDEPLDERELESIIDGHHAVILPYRQILNSGSAILALSRHRPVIAPAIGALPELRDAVGSDWVYLYHGDLTIHELRSAMAWVRDVPRATPDLRDYDWERVTHDLATLLGRVSVARRHVRVLARGFTPTGRHLLRKVSARWLGQLPCTRVPRHRIGF